MTTSGDLKLCSREGHDRPEKILRLKLVGLTLSFQLVPGSSHRPLELEGDRLDALIRQSTGNRIEFGRVPNCICDLRPILNRRRIFTSLGNGRKDPHVAPETAKLGDAQFPSFKV